MREVMLNVVRLAAKAVAGKPRRAAWEANLRALKSLTLSRISFCFRFLVVPGDSPIFPKIRDECAKSCQNSKIGKPLATSLLYPILHRRSRTYPEV
jgi:hypothetical protein